MNAQEWITHVTGKARECGVVLAFGDEVIPMDDDFFKAAYGDFAASLGRTVERLTPRQKQAALLNHIVAVRYG